MKKLLVLGCCMFLSLICFADDSLEKDAAKDSTEFTQLSESQLEPAPVTDKDIARDDAAKDGTEFTQLLNTLFLYCIIFWFLATLVEATVEVTKNIIGGLCRITLREYILFSIISSDNKIALQKTSNEVFQNPKTWFSYFFYTPFSLATIKQLPNYNVHEAYASKVYERVIKTMVFVGSLILVICCSLNIFDLKGRAVAIATGSDIFLPSLDKLMGLFVSAVLISLGSKFWHDKLNKIKDAKSLLEEEKKEAKQEKNGLPILQNHNNNMKKHITEKIEELECKMSRETIRKDTGQLNKFKKELGELERKFKEIEDGE